LTVAPATGALTGSFLLSNQVSPPPAKPVVRKVIISGTFRQGPSGSDGSLGHAHYLLDPSVDDTDTEQVSGQLELSR
jgi:hypothetical protein